MSQVKEFGTFLKYRKMQESRLTEIIPLIDTSAVCGHCPVFTA